MQNVQGEPRSRFLLAAALISVVAIAAGCAPTSTAPSVPAVTNQPSGATNQPSGGTNQPSVVAKCPDKLPVVKVSAFNPPSQGSFLPPIIAQKGIDKAHCFTLEMSYKPSNTYQTDYASGQDVVGSSATFISEARRAVAGVNTVLLFNMFDYYAGVVTTDPSIKTMKDLEGKTLAADTPTTTWAMGLWFLEKSGVDVKKVKVDSQGTAAMVTSIQTGRVNAVFVPEPTYSVLMHGENASKLHSIAADQKLWKELTGMQTLPLLGVAAHKSWVESNKELAQALYETYKEAAGWVTKNPKEASEMIAAVTKVEAKTLEEAIKSGRLGLNVQPTVATKETIMTALDMALKAKLVESVPKAESFFYTGLK